MAIISEFKFEIRYIKDKENRVENYLSRRIHVNHVASLSSYGVDLHDRILLVSQQDGKFMEIVHRL